MCIHHSSTLVAYTCIRSLMLEVILSRSVIAVCPHCCLVRGRWKKSRHRGCPTCPQAQQRTCPLPKLQQSVPTNQKAASRARISYGLNYVLGTSCSLVCLGLACALVLNEDATGTLLTSVAPDCCHAFSSPPPYLSHTDDSFINDSFKLI